MDVAIPTAVVTLDKPNSPSRVAIAACMLAGMCTFLNVYDTQPLLPYLQRLYHTSEIAVSFTVSATILAVALTAPFIGLLAESIGRKKVIVPSFYAITVPTLLAATSHNLHQLIFWRFMQGLFVPGVIVVMMAYIGEEFGGAYVGRAMASYITGTVLGGFGGRYISGMVAHHFDWRDAFLVIGVVNLAGAIIVQRWLPVAKNFVRAEAVRHSISHTKQHFWNPRLLAVFGMGFAALFCLVGTFTYANFYLAAPPYHLNSAQLGSIFFVYLFGLIVTPLLRTMPRSLRDSRDLRGRFRVRRCGTSSDAGALVAGDYRRVGAGIVGSVYLSGGGNGTNRRGGRQGALVRCRTLRDVLLHRRKPGSYRHRMDLGSRRLAAMRVPDDGSGGDGGGHGLRQQWKDTCQASGIGCRLNIAATPQLESTLAAWSRFAALPPSRAG